MVRKLIVVVVIAIMVIASLSTGALANDSTVFTNPADTVISYPQQKKHSIPLDTVISRFSKLAEVSGECFVMVKDGMRSEGVVGYIRKHLDVFAPIFAFIFLYLLWLRRRVRD